MFLLTIMPPFRHETHVKPENKVLPSAHFYQVVSPLTCNVNVRIRQQSFALIRCETDGSAATAEQLLANTKDQKELNPKPG